MDPPGSVAILVACWFHSSSTDQQIDTPTHNRVVTISLLARFEGLGTMLSYMYNYIYIKNHGWIIYALQSLAIAAQCVQECMTCLSELAGRLVTGLKSSKHR